MNIFEEITLTDILVIYYLFNLFTKFNNTVVMGSFLCGRVLYIPLYAFARLLVFVWRKYAADFIRNSKIFKVINKLPLISKIASMAGER